MQMGQPTPRIAGGGLLRSLWGRTRRSMFAIERRDAMDAWSAIARFGSVEEAAAALDEMVAEGQGDTSDFRITQTPRRKRR